MSANTQDYDFDDLDKPGAERSRRRRGEDDVESDFEEDLLEEDWLSAKKNSSEVSDEELNDDLLQSDEEDFNMTGQDISLNATYSSTICLDRQSSSQEAAYKDDVANHGSRDVGEEGYQQEEYRHEYSQGDTAEMPEDQMDYPGEKADYGYQDEVLDIEINEPIDGEFQEEDYQMSYDNEHHDGDEVQPEDPRELMGEEQQDEENATEEAQVGNTEEVEHLRKEETKEESDEEEEENEESGRIRFKSERKDGAVVRLSDAGSKRRDIPETLELSDKAKQDLQEFEEQERQKRQTRNGGRGGRGGGRGGRGRGHFPGFGMQDFRGGNRGRMNDRAPLMGNIGMQPSPRMPRLHQQPLQSQQHHSTRLRGPSHFQDHGRSSQPLQPLIHPHMSHRSTPIRPQMEPPPRMMNSPPPNFPQHHQQQQPPQPKNIHINPHFRGPASSSVQVPLMPPAQSQPRHAVGPQRFPGHGDFEQHMPSNFGHSQRSHHMEPFRNQLPQGPQDRESLYRGDCLDSSRFAGQPMFDHQGPGSLMSNSNNLHQQLSNQSHMGFGPPGPGFNQTAPRPLGLFSREPPRHSLPPHQSHQGMMNLNQQGGPPAQPRPFMGPRQPFGQQGNLFPPPQVQFGMPVEIRDLMHGLPVSQLPHHNPISPHQPMNQSSQHHRQELPHHHHQQSLSEPHPMMHHGQNPFHQPQAHSSPRQMTPRLQSAQQRNMSNRQRMNAPISKHMQQRNSNLRELPVAPGNTSSARPATIPASTNIRPVAKATPVVRPGQNPQWRSDVGRGRGQVTARTESWPGAGGGMAAGHKIPPRSPSSVKPQDPDEDEETRQYRLKIEQQKRLREEILKKKEMRRQMQAGVRKKELIERLNYQTNTANQCPQKFPPTEPSTPQTMQATPPQQQPLRPQQQPLQQRPFPQRTPQPLNNTLQNPNTGNIKPPSNPVQMLNTRANVKTRLQMGHQQNPLVLVTDQPMTQPQQNPNQHFQHQRNPVQQNINTTGAPIPTLAVPQHNIPLHLPDGLTQGLKTGAKRTVMQRTKNQGLEGQQVPQKVRVVKLSGATGMNPESTSEPMEQQGKWPTPLLNHDVQRKVTMGGQPQPGQGAAPQANRAGDPPQTRVVMSSRGRGRGGAQMGRGRPMSTRQVERDAESERRTVSIEGLSSSTTDTQLQNLLRSIGPIEMFRLMPQQRKAVAKFSCPEHAANFQISFHRHMIDLSHIDVSLIDG